MGSAARRVTVERSVRRVRLVIVVCRGSVARRVTVVRLARVARQVPRVTSVKLDPSAHVVRQVLREMLVSRGRRVT